MCPIVNIICSSPAMNTHSRKQNIPLFNPNQLANGDGALNIHYFFTLPNTMDNHEIIQVIQSNTTAYDLQDPDEYSITDWRRRMQE